MIEFFATYTDIDIAQCGAATALSLLVTQSLTVMHHPPLLIRAKIFAFTALHKKETFSYYLQMNHDKNDIKPRFVHIKSNSFCSP